MRRRAIAGTVLAAGLVAGGCGGGGDDRGTPAVPRSAMAAPLPAGRIAFKRFLDEQQSHAALYVVDTDGTHERPLTHPPAGTVDDQPDWSPDGRRIAFERCPSDSPCSVWTVRPDGSHASRVAVRCSLRPICDASAPSWTPDGRLVVGLAQGRERDHGTTDQIERFSIELVDPRRGTQRAILTRDHWSGDTAKPAVSPDGRTIAYVRINSWTSRPPIAQAVFTVGADGRGSHRLAPWSLGAGDHPVFSPDGTRVLFRSHQEDAGTQSDYWTAAPDGSHLTRLTRFTHGELALSASFAPDSRWIAVAVRGVDGQPDLAAMRADGGGVVRITRTPTWESAPDWGPPR